MGPTGPCVNDGEGGTWLPGYTCTHSQSCPAGRGAAVTLHVCRGGEGRQEGEVGRGGPAEHLGLSPTQGEKPSSRKGEGGPSPRLPRIHGTWQHLYVDPKGSQASQLGLTSLSAQAGLRDRGHDKEEPGRGNLSSSWLRSTHRGSSPQAWAPGPQERPGSAGNSNQLDWLASRPVWGYKQ